MPSIIVVEYAGKNQRIFPALFLLLLISFPEIAIAPENSRNGEDPLISFEERILLEKFGLSQLRDFVRGRGRGSVSRLSFSDGDPQKLPEPELAPKSLDEEEEGELAQIGQPPLNLFQIVMPSNHNRQQPQNMAGGTKKKENVETKEREKTKEEPRPEDYEKLAKILQKLLSRQKANEVDERGEGGEEATSKLGEDHHNLTTTTIAIPPEVEKRRPPMKGSVIGTLPVSVELGKSTVVEQNPKESEDGAIFTFSSSKKKIGSIEKNNNKEEVNLEVMPKALERVSWSGSVQKVVHERTGDGVGEANGPSKDNSKAAHRPQILGKMLIHRSELERNNAGKEGHRNEQKKTPKKGKAYVSVLREGLARQTDQQEYTFVASITLVRDQEKVILVDTGLATDINGRTDLIEKLGRLNIAPPGVHFVVTTHGHADHAGNTNDFPDATHFQGTMVHQRTKFNFSDLFESDRHLLTENVILIRTPGHTPEDISVVVSNTDRYGTVIVAGDSFLAAEDMDFPMMWRPLAWNETAQEESRRRILCAADYVVPGHGKVFRVTDGMRARVICADEGRRGRKVGDEGGGGEG